MKYYDLRKHQLIVCDRSGQIIEILPWEIGPALNNPIPDLEPIDLLSQRLFKLSQDTKLYQELKDQGVDLKAVPQTAAEKLILELYQRLNRYKIYK